MRDHLGGEVDKFSVGEIAIIVSAPANPGAVGMECEIIRLPDLLSSGEYGIHVPNYKEPPGKMWTIPERYLRKKQPPKEELGSWEELQKITEWGDKAGWNPTKEKVPYKLQLPIHQTQAGSSLNSDEVF